MTTCATILSSEGKGLPQEKVVTTRASLIECLKSSHDIIREHISSEHQESFLNDPENISNATFTEIFAKIEKKKLSYRERLSPHGWRIVRMVTKEKKIVDFNLN